MEYFIKNTNRNSIFAFLVQRCCNSCQLFLSTIIYHSIQFCTSRTSCGQNMSKKDFLLLRALASLVSMIPLFYLCQMSYGTNTLKIGTTDSQY